MTTLDQRIEERLEELRQNDRRDLLRRIEQTERLLAKFRHELAETYGSAHSAARPQGRVMDHADFLESERAEARRLANDQLRSEGFDVIVERNRQDESEPGRDYYE